jgi:ABC-2 type transport system permease protein
LLTQRLLSNTASTNVQSMIDYENKVRAFHASLREFYYQQLFAAPEFSKSSLKRLPQFTTTSQFTTPMNTQENTNEK